MRFFSHLREGVFVLLWICRPTLPRGHVWVCYVTRLKKTVGFTDVIEWVYGESSAGCR